MPPKGSPGSEATMPLMNTAPASMRGNSSRAAVSVSAVQRAAPSPYSVWLARVMASCVEETRTIAATGPKVSSSKAAWPGATWSMMVGS